MSLIVDSFKIPTLYFTEIEKSALKFIWSLKGPQIAKKKKNLDKEKVRGLTLPISILDAKLK